MKLPRDEALLKFEGKYAGVEVLCRLEVDIDLLLSFEEFDQTKPSELRQAFQLFGREVLISWNLEDDSDQAIEPGEDALLHVPPAFANALLDVWKEQVAGVAAPLGEQSSNGSTSAAPPIPMVPLSASQAS